MRLALLVTFALTYVAISARRLHLLPIGRPAASLVGACAMVALGALAGRYGLSGDEALRAVEPHTLALLFGMMVIAAGLDEAGFFARVTEAVARRGPSPVALVYGVTVGAGLLSAALVNDAVCLLATPLVARAARRLGAPLRPTLLSLAMGANAGSALTLAGNPQNMLVARLSGITYARYLSRAWLPALAALAVTAAVIHLAHRSQLAAPTAPSHDEVSEGEPRPGLLYASLVALAGVTVANLLGAPLAWSALCGAAVVIVAARERAEALIARVDVTVLVFFAGLFILVEGLNRTGYPAEALARVGASRGEGALVGVLSLGSQVVSNVPLILLLRPWIAGFDDPERAWTVTALVSTLAGNLTLLGSVANVIVFERARHDVGFGAYLRVGLPVTVASTAVAMALLRLMGGTARGEGERSRRSGRPDAAPPGGLGSALDPAERGLGGVEGPLADLGVSERERERADARAAGAAEEHHPVGLDGGGGEHGLARP